MKNDTYHAHCRWVSVGEALPLPGEYVVCYDPESERWWQGYYEHPFWMAPNGAYTPDCDPAFWMRMPTEAVRCAQHLHEPESLREINIRLLDALRELHDFAEPSHSIKYSDRSRRAFEAAAALLQQLEEPPQCQ